MSTDGPDPNELMKMMGQMFGAMAELGQQAGEVQAQIDKWEHTLLVLTAAVPGPFESLLHRLGDLRRRWDGMMQRPPTEWAEEISVTRGALSDLARDAAPKLRRLRYVEEPGGPATPV